MDHISVTSLHQASPCWSLTSPFFPGSKTYIMLDLESSLLLSTWNL